jgi:DNA-binding transcriptional regulator PaaX
MKKKTISTKLRFRSASAELLRSIVLSGGRLQIPKGNKKNFWQNLHRLKELGLLVFSERKKEIVNVGLTDTGLVEFFKLNIYYSVPLPEGRVCLVVFDIPEKYRTERLRLTFFLKRFDFERLQKSVWFSPFDVSEDLRKFLELTKFERWVYVFDADLP